MNKPYWYRLLLLALAPALVWAWLATPMSRWWLECFTTIFVLTLISGAIAENRLKWHEPDDPWPEFVRLLGLFVSMALGAAWGSLHAKKAGVAALCSIGSLVVSLLASSLRSRMEDPHGRGSGVNAETIKQGFALAIVGLFVASVLHPSSGWATLPVCIALAAGVTYIHWDRSHKQDPGIQWGLACLAITTGYGAYSAWSHLSGPLTALFGIGCAAAFGFAMICHDRVCIVDQKEMALNNHTAARSATAGE